MNSAYAEKMIAFKYDSNGCSVLTASFSLHFYNAVFIVHGVWRK